VVSASARCGLAQGAAATARSPLDARPSLRPGARPAKPRAGQPVRLGDASAGTARSVGDL